MASDQSDSLEWAKTRLPISSSLEISRSISNQIQKADFLAPSPGLCLLTSFVRTTASRNVKDLDLFNFSTAFLAEHQSNFLGEGATYRVTKGTPSNYSGLRDKWKAVAIKTAKVLIPRTLADLAIDDEHCHRLRSILFEVEILSHPSIRQHPNIATLLAYSWGALSGGFVPSLVMELATLGNARSFLSLQVLSDEQKLRVCSDVASGLQFLHACKIAHGDVKLDNVLVYEEEVTGFVVKIADFDRSPQSTEHNSYTGTRFYNAPEVQRQIGGSGKNLASSELWLCDVFAFGLLTLEVFAGVRFYGDLPGADRLINRINLSSQSEDEISILAIEVLTKAWRFSAPLLDICRKILEITLAISPFKRLQNGWLEVRNLLQETREDAPLLAEHFKPLINHPERSYSILELETRSRTIYDDVLGPRVWSELKYVVDNSKVQEERGRAAFNIFLCYSLGYAHREVQSVDEALEYIVSSAESGYSPAFVVGRRVFEANHVELPSVLRCGPKDETLRQALAQLDELPNEDYYCAAVQIFWPRVLRADAIRSLQGLSTVDSIPYLSAWINDQNHAIGNEAFKIYADDQFLFHQAVLAGSYTACELLIELGCNINIHNLDGITPLNLASRCAEVELIRLLLKHGADSSLNDFNGTSPLHWLILIPEEDVSSVAAAIVSNSRDRKCFRQAESQAFLDELGLVAEGTPLGWAIGCQNQPAIRALLENKIIEPDDLTTLITHLKLAMHAVSPQTANYLLSYTNCHHSLSLDEKGELCDAIGSNTFLSEFQRWMIHGAFLEKAYHDLIDLIDTIKNFNLCSHHVPQKHTVHTDLLYRLLYRAVVSFKMPLIQELLRRGADINQTHGNSPLDHTALGLAIANSNTWGQVHKVCEVIKFLESCGGTTLRMTPISMACFWFAPEEVMQVLISSHPDDINVKCLGMSPLSRYIIIEGEISKVKLLVDAGADIQLEDDALSDRLKYMDYGRTPLANALDNLNWAVAQYLLDNGASITFGVKIGRYNSVLHLLVLRAFREAANKLTSSMETLLLIIRRILDHRTGRQMDLINNQNHEGVSPLEMAIKLGLPEVVEILAAESFFPEHMTMLGSTLFDRVTDIHNVGNLFCVEGENLVMHVDMDITKPSMSFSDYRRRLKKIKERFQYRPPSHGRYVEIDIEEVD